MRRVRAGLWIVLVLCVLVPWLALAQDAAVIDQPVAAGQNADGMITMGLGVLLALSEGLALIPKFQANGVLHGAILVLRKMLGKPA